METTRESLYGDIVQLHAQKLRALQDDALAVPGETEQLAREVQKWQSDVQQPGLTLDRQAELAVELDRLKAKEAELVKRKEATYQYLLEAIPYLNVQHSLVSDLLQGSEDKASLRSQLRVNAASYLRAFYPGDTGAREAVAAAGADTLRCECGGEIVEAENSYHVCEKCGIVQAVGISDNQTNNLNWSDLQNAPGRQYTYKRLNHFREYLRQVQGRCRASIPQDVLQRLQSEFEKTRVPTKAITGAKVRKALKKIKLSKYYEHVENIACLLNRAYKPLVIPPEHEETLCLMFAQLERPFDEVKHIVAPDRKNFLSYPYVFFKLNELNGWDDYNRGCTLLKSVELLNRQDRWWKLVMNKVGWQNCGRTFDSM